MKITNAIKTILVQLTQNPSPSDGTLGHHWCVDFPPRSEQSKDLRKRLPLHCNPAPKCHIFAHYAKNAHAHLYTWNICLISFVIWHILLRVFFFTCVQMPLCSCDAARELGTMPMPHTASLHQLNFLTCLYVHARVHVDIRRHIVLHFMILVLNGWVWKPEG